MKIRAGDLYILTILAKGTNFLERLVTAYQCGVLTGKIKGMELFGGKNGK